jgi:hypothetical protein
MPASESSSTSRGRGRLARKVGVPRATSGPAGAVHEKIDVTFWIIAPRHIGDPSGPPAMTFWVTGGTGDRLLPGPGLHRAAHG